MECLSLIGPLGRSQFDLCQSMDTQVVTDGDYLNCTDSVETVRATVAIQVLSWTSRSTVRKTYLSYKKIILYILRQFEILAFEPSIANTKLSGLANVVTTTNSLDGR